jgi:hypothetical protein
MAQLKPATEPGEPIDTTFYESTLGNWVQMGEEIRRSRKKNTS